MKHQDIMNKAYERWQDNWTQKEFWNQLSFIEKAAVFTGNLNYQVENGGFMQWIDNGYIECIIELIDILENHIGTEISIKVSNLVYKSSERFTDDNYECDYCVYGCKCEPEIYEDDDGNEYEEYDCWCNCECSYPEYGDLSDEYYEINEQFLIDVQNWLDKQED